MTVLTLTETILSRVMQRPVIAGDILYPVPDLITVHDWYVVNFDNALAELGVDRVLDPDRILISTDHEPVAVSAQAVERQRKVREIVGRHGIKQFFDAGRGGHGHVFPLEMGRIRPGMFVLGYDVHVTNFGAVGCLAIPLGTEISEVLACGSAWISVPETVRVNIVGELRPGIVIRDVAQRMIADMSADLVDYAVVEFGGPGLGNLSIDQRITLCNTPIEIGAKSAIMEVDDIAIRWLEPRVGATVAPLRAEPNARYRAIFDLDLGLAEPQVAIPPTPDNVVPVRQVAGRRIDQAFIGSCASGTIEDLRAAASILQGRTIAAHSRLIITPATNEIALNAAEEGLIATFIAAGASVTPPGCGPCAGGRIGPLAEGEVSINTGTRNDPGRLGAKDAEIYLASPLTVAASAVAGQIVDPRDYLA